MEYRLLHSAVGKLFACEREPKNAVGMYCGGLSDTEWKVVAMSHLRVLKRSSHMK